MINELQNLIAGAPSATGYVRGKLTINWRSKRDGRQHVRVVNVGPLRSTDLEDNLHRVAVLNIGIFGDVMTYHFETTETL